MTQEILGDRKITFGNGVSDDFNTEVYRWFGNKLYKLQSVTITGDHTAEYVWGTGTEAIQKEETINTLIDLFDSFGGEYAC